MFIHREELSKRTALCQDNFADFGHARMASGMTDKKIAEARGKAFYFWKYLAKFGEESPAGGAPSSLFFPAGNVGGTYLTGASLFPFPGSLIFGL